MRHAPTVALPLVVALLAACSKKPADAKAEAERTPTIRTADPAQLVNPIPAMYAVIDEQSARTEHGAGEVKIQHLLVGVTHRLTGVQRAPGDAEKLAAELFARARAGEDFDTLVKNHSDDKHASIYTMLASGTGDRSKLIFTRAEMVPGFGNVAWRLEVGEFGVAPFDPQPPDGRGTSEYGYHIVKRLQ